MNLSLTTSEWAAWVQAVGAITAMGITVALWLKDRASRRKIAAARARSAALALLPPLTDLANTLTWAYEQITTHGQPAYRIGTAGPGQDTALWDIDPYPEKVSGMHFALAELGAAAAPAQRAFRALQEMDADRNRSSAGMMWEGPEWGYSQEEVARAIPLLKQAADETRVAIAALKNLFD